MNVHRRSFLAGLGALIAAPAIVRPESLMALAPTERILFPRNYGLEISRITREAVTLFKNSNVFLQEINDQYESEFGCNGALIGTTLCIRLPADYIRTVPAIPQLELSATEAAALGAAAVLTKNPALSRRFWASHA